jgi:hypothetical protein
MYLYCLARPHVAAALEGTGLDECSPLATCEFEDVAAVVSRVRLEDFCGPEAEARMQNLEWLGPRVLRHEAVIEQVMRFSAVLPARFGTIFSAPERLAEFLSKHRAAISHFLDSVTGMKEWGVKGIVDRARARARILSQLVAAEEGKLSLSPGIRYFQQQRARADADKEVNRRLKTVCGRIVEELSHQASGSCQRKVLRYGSEGHGGEVVLNWAFLVPDSRVAAFRAQVDQVNAEYAPQGLVFELSGPWPPYSFCPSLGEGS